MSALNNLLNTYQAAVVTEHGSGTYFEELVASYLHNEASYHDLYSHVWTYIEQAKTQGLDARVYSLT